MVRTKRRLITGDLYHKFGKGADGLGLSNWDGGVQNLDGATSQFWKLDGTKVCADLKMLRNTIVL